EPCFGADLAAWEAAVVGGAAGLEEVAVVDAGEMGRALGWKGKNAVMGRPWPRRCCEAEEEAPGAAIGVALRGVFGKDSIMRRRDSREARPGFHLRRNVVEGDRMRRHRLGTGPPGGVDLFKGQAAGILPLHEGQLHDLSSGILLELLRDELMDHLRIPFLRNTHRAE
ncbi:unnamed protein product, partial [Effrenium voratum]